MTASASSRSIPPARLEPIELYRLPRADHFRAFTESVPCTFAMTVPLDVTGAVARHRSEGVPLYALLMHAILGVMNAPDLPEFRFDWCTGQRSPEGKSEDEVPGVWTRVGANFTHMNPDTKTFASLWLPWVEDETEFVALYRETIERFGRSPRMVPQGSIPPNHVPISMIPWAAYTGFQVNFPNFRYLRPVVTMGKFGPSAADPARLTLPFTLQLHHATADGCTRRRPSGASSSQRVDTSSDLPVRLPDRRPTFFRHFSLKITKL